MITLTNEAISIAVLDHGAELCSIKKNGREYLWQSDEKYWKRYSPVLFPFVGNVWEKKYRVEKAGQPVELPMSQHGFARDMDFVLVERTKDSVLYRLCSDSETRKRYPYDFVLEIGYRLQGNQVEVLWRVINPMDEVLHYQIGAHPAFYWPLLSDDQIAAGTASQEERLAKDHLRGYFHFDTDSQEVVSRLIGEGGCIRAEERRTEKLENGYMRLMTETFDHDALVLEDDQVHQVTLCGEDKKPYLTLDFDTHLVGLWSQPGKNAPFVCIEPWYGRADGVGYKGLLPDREHMQHLDPKQIQEYRYTITIH